MNPAPPPDTIAFVDAGFINKYKYVVVFLAALVPAYLFSFHQVGFNVLIPTNVHFLLFGDLGTHYLGWHIYRSEPWSFPLGAIRSYYYPVGTNIAYTDSIPLVAIPLKLLHPLLPYYFQYFGLWYLLCSLLYAFFALLLVRAIEMPFYARFVAAQIFLFCPLFITGKTPALSAHWILLASIYLYYRGHGQDARISARRFFPLLLVSAAVHPYLLAMAFAFFCAHLSRGALSRSISPARAVGYLAAATAGILLSLFAIGYLSFGGGAALQEGGYGASSFNLSAFVNPVGTSLFYKGFPMQNNRQAIVSYSYLGIGVFFLLSVGLLAAAFVHRKSLWADLRHHLFGNASFYLMAVLCILLLVFGLGNEISWKDRVVFRYPLPRSLYDCFSIFRFSARFVWPVHYLIVFSAILLLARTIRNRLLLNALLTCGLSLQIADLLPMTRSVLHIENKEYDYPIDEKGWDRLFAEFDNVLFYPPLSYNALRTNDFIPFSLLLSKRGRTINIGRVARGAGPAEKEYYDRMKRDIALGRFGRSTLYVTTPDYLPEFAPQIAKGRMKYRELDGYLAISPISDGSGGH